jgi:uncharacterized protein (DUF1810 family)
MMRRGAMAEDRYNLHRFVEAQDRVFEQVCSELRAGEKSSHWMWFIFPQVQGLGYSSTARYFAISNLDEARAYLEHPVLGPRLMVCTDLVLDISVTPIEQIFGYPDYLKFRSSMTLFARAAVDARPFQRALDKYFGGEEDGETVKLLR